MKIRNRLCRMRDPESPPLPDASGRIISTIQDTDFMHGEVYLFHKTDPECPAGESLMGMFDRRIGRTVYLRMCTTDMIRFEEFHCLAADCRYCRVASREELRRYLPIALRRL